MTLLLNFVLPLLVVICITIGWGYSKYYKSKPKGILIGLAWFAMLFFIYSKIQPSYLPKGKVPVMSEPIFETSSDISIEDRVLKPALNEKEREERLDNLLTFKKEVKQINNEK